MVQTVLLEYKLILRAVAISQEPGYLSGIALGYGLDDRGFESRQGLEFFSSPPHPNRLWGPPSLLSNRYEALFPCG
jgi:hypothetical protein